MSTIFLFAIIFMGIAGNLQCSQMNDDQAQILYNEAQVRRGDVIKGLLKQGFNIDARDEQGNTALMKAAIANNLEAIKLLLKLGANPYLSNKRFETAEFLTTSEKIQDFFIRHYQKDLQSKDILSRKYKKDYATQPFVFIENVGLGKRGVGNYQLTVTPDRVVLMWHSRGHLPSQSFLDSHIIEPKTDQFDKFNKESAAGAFYQAAKQGRADVIKRLQQVGFDINGEEWLRHKTALMRAAENNNAGAVKLLLKFGANVDAISSEYGKTAESLTTSEIIKKIIADYKKLQTPEHKELVKKAQQKIISRIALPEDIVSEVQEYLGY